MTSAFHVEIVRMCHLAGLFSYIYRGQRVYPYTFCPLYTWAPSTNIRISGLGLFSYISIGNKECTPTLFVSYIIEDSKNDPTLCPLYYYRGQKVSPYTLRPLYILRQRYANSVVLSSARQQMPLWLPL